MEVALEETLSRMESELQNIREEHPEDWFDEVLSLINIFNRDTVKFKKKFSNLCPQAILSRV